MGQPKEKRYQEPQEKRHQEKKSRSGERVPLGMRGAAELATLWLGRVLALGLLAFSPWYYGMVTWRAQTWLVPWVAAIFLLAIASLCLSKSAGLLLRKLCNPGSVALCGLLLIALLQTLVLPAGLWSAIAPAAAFERRVDAKASAFLAELAQPATPLVDLSAGAPPAIASAAIEAPQTMSIHPLQTRASAAVWGAAVAMMLACGVLFRGRQGNLLLLAVIGITAIANTLLGLFQSLGWVDWQPLDGIRSTSFATFISPNSAPQYIALGIGSMAGILGWWGKKLRKEDRRFQVRYPSLNPMARFGRRLQDLLLDVDRFSLVLLFGLCLLLVGGLATFSRGGIIAILFAGLATLVLAFSKERNAWFRGLGVLVVVCFVAALLLSSVGLDQRVMLELDTLNEETHQLSDVRFDIWKASVAEPAYWLAGCGLGTYHFGILPSFDELQAAWYYHAENIYVELFMELGGIGFLLGAIGGGWLVYKLLQLRHSKRRNDVLYPALAFALAALGLHALVDFSLIIPAIFLSAGALVGCFMVDCEVEPSKRRKQRDAREVALEKLKGGKPAVEPELADTATPGAAPVKPWVWGTAMAAGGLILLAMAQGYASLQGFAAGERLASELGQYDKTAETVESIDVEAGKWLAAAEPFRGHPEVVLQMARLRQKELSHRLRTSSAWPEGSTSALKASLATPETMAAACRGGAEGRLADMLPLLTAELELLLALEATGRSMQFALAACPLDWRASWGGLRADLGRGEPAERCENYARLALTTSHHPRLMKTIGTNALWAREAQVGLEFLQPTLSVTPMFWGKVIPLLDGQRSTEEVLAMLPDSPLVQTMIAQGVESVDKGHPVAAELLQQADLLTIFEAADNQREWLHVAWVAQFRKEPYFEIDAVKKVLSQRPEDAALRYRLARLYDSTGNLQLARDEMLRVTGYDATNKTYQNYLKQLGERMLMPPRVPIPR